MTEFSCSPLSIFTSVKNNWSLIGRLIARDVTGRYRGSVFGILWSFITPILMLAVYTLVFGVIFQSRWSVGTESKVEFALVLFAGLIVFNFFSECLNRASTLILVNSNFVKKVVFPLEVLPVVVATSTLFHFCASFLIWLIAYVLFIGLPHATALLIPFVVLPLVLFSTGLVFALSSLGVFFRDISQFVGMLTTVVMFLSPIFYPLEAFPAQYRGLLLMNPLTPSIEQARSVLIKGEIPDFSYWIWNLLLSICVFWAGYFLFQKMRKGFADVL